MVLGIIAAITLAKSMGIQTITLTGNKGGKLATLADININVPSDVTARIQESHGCVIHCICELVEEQLA